MGMINNKQDNLLNSEHNIVRKDDLSEEVDRLSSELSLKQKELENKSRELSILKHEFELLQSFHNNIYEKSPIGHFTIDREGNILKSNSAGAFQLGLSKELLTQKTIYEFVSAEKHEQLRSCLENVCNYHKQSTCEIKIERRNKSSFNAILDVVPFDNDYNLICLAFLSDISALKETDAILKESEAHFQSLANSAPVLIWIADSNALFTFVNNYWLEFTGRTFGQEIGMNWIEGIHPEDINNFIQIYRLSFNKRAPLKAEFRLRKNDGTYRWIAVNGIPRLHSDGRFAGYIGSCTDINDQKENEEKVKQFNEELKSLNAGKDKFFSIIAHDLKSPLSGLLGFTEILVDEYEELQDEEKREFIEHSHQAAKSLMALLENLLEWSRVQTGNVSFSPVRLNVESIVDEVYNLFSQNAKGKAINLKKNIDPGIEILADKNMFKTILRNLISNGIKFTSIGGSITISAEAQSDCVKICIKDSGVGISQNNISKLFKIDRNFTTAGTSNERGTGLGLILCKELVEKNGGKILVESEVGKGTLFSLTFPKG